ncbi:hypothetical protein BCR44DRAFT_34443 [Catenaria anguillulae PL171]|uniref:Uncharacterized protein n=1 Tax=Catenaria anguillulae PL171 TaxID=765915 RepID=A0A1Y2I4J8_9FUNG|nr:hypothetical protein BCR44DRAFT_34443 [Catenaria anguillulae PL171]
MLRPKGPTAFQASTKSTRTKQKQQNDGKPQEARGGASTRLAPHSPQETDDQRPLK